MPKKDSDESDYDDEQSQQQKIPIRKPKIQRLDKFKNLKKIVINLSMTQYPVVTDVADHFNWKIQYDNDAGDWDVYWTDFSIDPDVLIKMHFFQKINYYPGVYSIARKNLLGFNLMNMKNKFPQDYNFFPLTWMLPQQYAQFRQYYQNKPVGKTRTYIAKPEAECQGRGIFLTRKIQQLQNGKHYVVQRYIARPYLIQGLKFDLRIYVLLCGTNPLRLYIYQEGLGRFATQKYVQPNTQNLELQYMHLTNYAINKLNSKYIFNASSTNMDVGHKRSLSAIYKILQKKGINIKNLKEKINDLIIKTIIVALPLMSHQYKCSQPEDYSNNMCFHILGFDVMLNNKQEPQLIQVNHTPSFATDTPLDYKIKFNLIKDTLQLMNINIKKKTELFNKSKQVNKIRLHTGKRQIFEGQQRQNMIKQEQKLRDQYQNNNLGGYSKIFPIQDQQKMKYYNKLIQSAQRTDNTPIRIKLQQKQARLLKKDDIKKMKKVQAKAQQNQLKSLKLKKIVSEKVNQNQQFQEMNKNNHSMNQLNDSTTKNVQISNKSHFLQNTSLQKSSDTEIESSKYIKLQQVPIPINMIKSEIQQKKYRSSSIQKIQYNQQSLNDCNKIDTAKSSILSKNISTIEKQLISSQKISNFEAKNNVIRISNKRIKDSNQFSIAQKIDINQSKQTKKYSQRQVKFLNAIRINKQVQDQMAEKNYRDKIVNTENSNRKNSKLKQFPNIQDNMVISDLFTRPAAKSKDIHKKIKSQSRQGRLIDSIAQDMKQIIQKKNKGTFQNNVNQINHVSKVPYRKFNLSQNHSNNSQSNFNRKAFEIGPGGFVMPKIFNLSVENEKNYQLNFHIISMKKKIEGTN